MRYSLIFIFGVIIFSFFLLNGCIRTANDLQQEKCGNYKEDYAIISCYRYKASYLAALGKPNNALLVCKEIKDVYGTCGPGTFFQEVNPILYLGENEYNECISDVAYYSNRIDICNAMETSCEGTLGSILRKVFGGSSSADIKAKKIKRCQERLREKMEMENMIKDNFKYIGFTP